MLEALHEKKEIEIKRQANLEQHKQLLMLQHSSQEEEFLSRRDALYTRIREAQNKALRL